MQERVGDTTEPWRRPGGCDSAACVRKENRSSSSRDSLIGGQISGQSIVAISGCSGQASRSVIDAFHYRGRNERWRRRMRQRAGRVRNL